MIRTQFFFQLFPCSIVWNPSHCTHAALPGIGEFGLHFILKYPDICNKRLSTFQLKQTIDEKFYFFATFHFLVALISLWYAFHILSTNDFKK